MEAKKSRLKPKIMFYEILYGKTPTLSDVEKLPPVGEVIKKVAAKEPALLSERYQEILRLRYIEGEKLAHIAGEYGVSKQRIDQLCTNITDKIRLILMMYN